MTGQRRVLMLTHTGRDEARDVALAFCKALTGHGIVVRLIESEARDLGLDPAAYEPTIELTAAEAGASEGCELALVIGGDGTILRAAEVTHGAGTPVLGVNLGHVGFLAEAEYDRRRVDHRRDRAAPLHRRGPDDPRRPGVP